MITGELIAWGIALAATCLLLFWFGVSYNEKQAKKPLTPKHLRKMAREQNRPFIASPMFYAPIVIFTGLAIEALAKVPAIRYAVAAIVLAGIGAVGAVVVERIERGWP